MSTMVGIGRHTSQLREADAEPVYLLTQRRSSVPPPVRAVRPETWDDVDAALDVAPDVDDEFSDIRLIDRTARRSRVIRVFGIFAIVGVLGGGAYVLRQPQVQKEALSFVTMGHEEGATRVARRLATIVDGLRHR